MLRVFSDGFKGLLFWELALIKLLKKDFLGASILLGWVFCSSIFGGT